MGRKEKKTGYSPITLARRLIFERGEVARMIEDGRLTKKDAAAVADGIDDALEAIFISWLRFKEKKSGYPHIRSKWDRTKWEKKLAVGMHPEAYKTVDLQRAELHDGGVWDEPNFGGE